jgi:hypothetical protein
MDNTALIDMIRAPMIRKNYRALHSLFRSDAVTVMSACVEAGLLEDRELRRRVAPVICAIGKAVFETKVPMVPLAERFMRHKHGNSNLQNYILYQGYMPKLNGASVKFDSIEEDSWNNLSMDCILGGIEPQDSFSDWAQRVEK